jgi:proteasome lid subunit RPN8/RPN11
MNNQAKETALELPRSLVNQILAHAQKNPDEEICGLISSKNEAAARYYQITNTAENKSQRFEMNGSQQIAAMKQMREQGEELMAIVHSHPDAPAIPSALDKEDNHSPDVYYLVVSLDTKGVLELRCFLPSKKDDGTQEFKLAELVLEQLSATY